MTYWVLFILMSCGRGCIEVRAELMPKERCEAVARTESVKHVFYCEKLMEI